MFTIHKVKKDGKLNSTVLAQGHSIEEAWEDFNNREVWRGYSQKSQFRCINDT